jgi:mono/diheme cytochrome c family protein
MNRILSAGSVLMLVIAAVLPPAGAQETTDPGMELYNKKCAICHGKDGVAKKMAEGSANLNDPAWQKATSIDAIVHTIAEGKGKMPANKDKLSADEIKSIADYVKKLK